MVGNCSITSSSEHGKLSYHPARFAQSAHERPSRRKTAADRQLSLRRFRRRQPGDWLLFHPAKNQLDLAQMKVRLLELLARFARQHARLREFPERSRRV